MNSMGKLFIIVAVATFLVTSFLILNIEVFHWTYSDDFNYTEQELNISNLSSNVYYENVSDQYGNLITQHFVYMFSADIYSIDLSNNYTVKIKAYDSEGNYLKDILENRSLTSLDSTLEDSNNNIVYRYYSDILVDYVYVFEIYDDYGKIVYNQTVVFDLNNVTSFNSIEYRSNIY